MANGLREDLISNLMSHLAANHIPYKLSTPKNGTTLKIKNEVLIKKLTIANKWGDDGIVLPKIISDLNLTKVNGQRFKRWCGTYVLTGNYREVYSVLKEYASILNSGLGKIRKKRKRKAKTLHTSNMKTEPTPGKLSSDGKGIYLIAKEEIKAGNLVVYRNSDGYKVANVPVGILLDGTEVAGIATETAKEGDVFLVNLFEPPEKQKTENNLRITEYHPNEPTAQKKRRIPKKKKI